MKETMENKKLDEISIFPFPTGTNRLYGFAEYLYLSSKSKNPDLAAKFLDYLSSTEVQQKCLGVIGSTSVNKNVKYANQNELKQFMFLKLLATLYEPLELPLDGSIKSR